MAPYGPVYGPGMRRSLVTGSVLIALAALTGARPPAAPPLPQRLADTGGGSQLITAEAASTGATTGTVTWWSMRSGRWVAAGSAPARFGANGLTEGASRVQGTDTTPTGLYDLPYAFGVKAAGPGTRYPYRRVQEGSWWCQDNAARAYNRWVEPRPADCRASEAEQLITYRTQYARALVVGFNYHRPVRGRGAGIFLHVNGPGATAGCVSVPAAAMDRILAWADPARRPHLAIGTGTGPTAITRY
ncbi:L,D-peptidoglycan transpeptidase YkuD (ErfK/YbiS/YcfS/YnhG family) [Streptomyces brevispora]|uniref:L,D-peptidoglycan transpeptidase YkuD (ErfK/YbiS/YcfS/YnhG family) n=2 Tax=Streptomyces brevispora TaxID=887462 RepID=A0A561URH4_9ACTN|nr:L,D-peptidoglycan transpeptidase YkuD (ErfK/YbiS/YcfS/YnhG family) [Streptomyces brevispora]